MTMTEAEAKTKWCPNVRIAVHAGHGGAACNRHPEGSVKEDTLCIASACMFWRWDVDSSPAMEALAKARMQSEMTQARAMSYVPTRGYCGQAGKP